MADRTSSNPDHRSTLPHYSSLNHKRVAIATVGGQSPVGPLYWSCWQPKNGSGYISRMTCLGTLYDTNGDYFSHGRGHFSWKKILQPWIVDLYVFPCSCEYYWKCRTSAFFCFSLSIIAYFLMISLWSIIEVRLYTGSSYCKSTSFGFRLDLFSILECYWQYLYNLTSWSLDPSKKYDFLTTRSWRSIEM